MIYFILYSSLPDLDGTKKITLLNQGVTIERDAQGIPTIRGKHRQDTAFALGYVHAQERYFQMDLLRRSAAGELAALFGDDAYESDVKIRLHRFRERAKQAVRKLPKAHYAALVAYSNGVNTGIESLVNDPYQYLLLGQTPKPWEPEDSLLCVYAMYFDLNDELGVRETSLAILKDELPPSWFKFLTPKGGEWDAAMDDSALEDVKLSIPSLSLPKKLLAYNLSTPALFVSKLSAHPKQTLNFVDRHFLPGTNTNFLPGSNSWAVDASLTPYDSAMMANDMHLTLRVPNIWFRASWYLEDGRRVTGVTLPGTPAMVVGSNEHIAWGFTNSYGNWGDIIVLQTNADETQYQSAEGWKNFTVYKHLIESSNGSDKELLTIETQWGPVIGRNHKGQLLAHQWLAYSPNATNLNLLVLEKSDSVKDALDVAKSLGMPPQSIVIADNEGHIGWTIAGLIPKRDEAAMTGGWQDYEQANDYPILSDPDSHRIWTANNRLFSAKTLSHIGFEGGDLGARAQQVRDGLLAKTQFKETDFLAIQLDNEAKLLARWRQLLLDVLTAKNIHEVISKGQVESMLAVLKKEPILYAKPDSVAYGLVKSFRKVITKNTLGWVFETLEKQHPKLFKASLLTKLIEYPVWELVQNRPVHLVPANYANWALFFQASAEQAYNIVTDNGQYDLATQSWGVRHKIDIQHPLSAALPELGFFLDMPDSPLSGDTDMPKVLGHHFGASVRMVVAPGQEQKAIMHMPAGQSSHPLSSYYSSGHQDWVDGKASAFLPGETKWVLELQSIQ
ncbi:penicillin acylase family protein [sulfur-oxidizing endosymbiont of Gigantopelta aegis]|uniref:penicillin acylase family protein n=1 Tax=sulfur-oxidizing endosymbiont of Gigantopelta aegis TaxID=2794934 RepID=UPI001BE418FB|nr:penicillin acylase family protein [sulfur-oxidizing endosymbiont of Gigantopelta aegis]